MSSRNDMKFATNFVSIHLILNHPTFRGNCKAKSSTLCLLEGTVKEEVTMLLVLLRKSITFRSSKISSASHLPTLHCDQCGKPDLYRHLYDRYQSNKTQVCSLLLLESLMQD